MFKKFQCLYDAHGTNSFLQGGRELDDFIKYIAKEATTELKGWDRKGKARKVELWGAGLAGCVNGKGTIAGPKLKSNLVS